MQDLLFRTNRVIAHEIDVTRHQLMRNNVEVIPATASFVGPDAIRLEDVGARRLTYRQGQEDHHRRRGRDHPRPAYPVRRQPHLYQ